MEVLKLSKPIMVNGSEVKELKYDFENFTAQDQLMAAKRCKGAEGLISVQELDPSFHLHMFAVAVEKAMPGIDYTDVMRMHAKDAIKAQGKVRSFFFLDLEDSLESNTSEGQ